MSPRLRSVSCSLARSTLDSVLKPGGEAQLFWICLWHEPWDRSLPLLSHHPEKVIPIPDLEAMT